MPWVESPLFYKILREIDLTEEEKKLAIQYHEEGYVVIDLDIDPEPVKDSADRVAVEGKKQEDGYHYSLSPRGFEGWRAEQPILDLARHPKVLSTLKTLYGREAKPFQTINFVKGSNQPLHSDVIHFHTEPGLWMVGVWTALEGVDDFNGPLVFVPKSHRLPVYDLQTLNLPVPEYGKQFESYRKYEEFIDGVVRYNDFRIRKFHAKPGQALIWAANLIHGGATIMDKNRTRYSQATHYYFPGCEHYYSPMFSRASAGIYSEKDLSTKDILNHVIV